MLGSVGRFVVLGFAGLAAVGYGMTALQSVSAPGATAWPIVGLCAAAIALIVIVYVAFSSASWTNSNRYARTGRGRRRRVRLGRDLGRTFPRRRSRLRRWWGRR